MPVIDVDECRRCLPILHALQPFYSGKVLQWMMPSVLQYASLTLPDFCDNQLGSLRATGGLTTGFALGILA